MPLKDECAQCELCERPVSYLTRHHLVPRTRHKNKKVLARFSREEMQTNVLMLCKSCHKQLHNMISEKELSDRYYTLEKLLQHAELMRFVSWIKDKPADFVARSYRRKS